MAPAPLSQTNGMLNDDLLPSTEDLLYEEELLRNPFSLKMWWRYLEARRESAASKRYVLYERALKSLPGSYKLWKAYLTERRAEVRGLALDNPRVVAMNNTYERALVTMHKMPRIWLDYLDHLMGQFLLTQTRRAFDRALCSLPITQHDRIWQLYLEFVMQPGIPPETAMKVYRRYLKIEPTHVEEYIAYLKAKGMWGEAAKRLADSVNDELFRSLEGKSKHQLWLELCDIITKHPAEVAHLKVDAILRSGIRKFTDEVGKLWTSLADYYIRQGMMEKARDVYEEGLNTVTTVRDFSLIFDTLTHFEESLITYKMQQQADEEEVPEDNESDGENFVLKDNISDLDLRLARLDYLIKRRPELLSSVMLRQNPHNVHEWHKRVKLFDGQPERQIKVFAEAVATVDPDKAIGKPFTLWTAFARFYEKHNSLDNARVIFEKATAVPFKYVDDLASVWCEYAEMELRHQNYKRALDLLRRATAAPSTFDRRQKAAEREGPVQGRLYRSLKLWSFYCDLEESLGTLESTRAVYNRILELRIATPQIILNYALFLQENKYFEESFQVYERGIALFKWPHVKDIWQAYLSQFVERYKGTKLERARDLFKQALDKAPPAEAKDLFLQHAALEENYGLARSAMEVYDLAVRTVPRELRLPLYDLYLARASEFFGLGKVREIYETAIEAEEAYQLTDEDTKTLCLRYAKLEKDVGEVDRARAIYVHASSLANPATDKGFWQSWNDFEVQHGNEDTFREMRRIMRSVNASFSQTHFNMAIIDAVSHPTTGAVEAGSEELAAARGGDSMEALEAAAAMQPGTQLPGFVSAGIVQPEKPADADGLPVQDHAPAPMAANPEDIDLGEDENMDQDEAAANVDDEELQQKAVPEAVFGAAGAGKEEMGALDRFAKRRRTEAS